MSENNENDIIVGLAGHIDHGKTTLIKALNGFDGDSLEEEKRRGITMDLSFSHLSLPSRNVAFIDVPGHHKLVKNMIAGIFGADILMLVIAANEGIMPQTLEHIKIASMLGLQSCVCVITKIDKVADSSDLTRLERDIKDILESSHITLFRTIGVNLMGECNAEIEAIKNALGAIKKPKKVDFGLFLYYIDRAFSIKGIGCVVTGSVLSGSCGVGERLYIYHLGREVGVRGIESHDKIVEKATPSHRIALNLTQISHSEIKRGYLISQKGYLRGFDSIDVGIFGAVRHNGNYQLYLGSSKISAKVVLLGEILSTHHFGKETMNLARIKCDEAVFSVYGQRFILRDEEREICGGVVLNPIIEPLKKSMRIELLKALAERDFGGAFTKLAQIHKKGFGLISSTQRFGLSHKESLEIAGNLKDIFVDSKALTLYPAEQIEVLKRQILGIFKRNNEAMLSATSLTLKAKWISVALAQRAFDELLENGEIQQKNGLYFSRDCAIKDISKFLQDKIFHILHSQHLSPPAPYNIYDELEIDRNLGDSALRALTNAQKVVRISHNLFVSAEALREIITLMREIIAQEGYVDVGNLREKVDLSRKYLIGYLEYLDKFDDIESKDNKRYFKYAQKG